MGYCGTRTIEALRTETRFLQVTPASVRESHPMTLLSRRKRPTTVSNLRRDPKEAERVRGVVRRRLDATNCAPVLWSTIAVVLLTCSSTVWGDESAPQQLSVASDARPIALNGPDLNSPQGPAGTLRFSTAADTPSSRQADTFRTSGSVLRWKSREPQTSAAETGFSVRQSTGNWQDRGQKNGARSGPRLTKTLWSRSGSLRRPCTRFRGDNQVADERQRRDQPAGRGRNPDGERRRFCAGPAWTVDAKIRLGASRNLTRRSRNQQSCRATASCRPPASAPSRLRSRHVPWNYRLCRPPSRNSPIFSNSRPRQ